MKHILSCIAGLILLSLSLTSLGGPPNKTRVQLWNDSDVSITVTGMLERSGDETAGLEGYIVYHKLFSREIPPHSSINYTVDAQDGTAMLPLNGNYWNLLNVSRAAITNDPDKQTVFKYDACSTRVLPPAAAEDYTLKFEMSPDGIVCSGESGLGH